MMILSLCDCLFPSLRHWLSFYVHSSSSCIPTPLSQVTIYRCSEKIFVSQGCKSFSLESRPQLKLLSSFILLTLVGKCKFFHCYYCNTNSHFCIIYLQYTPAIDIWSIGCIFAELLTGKPLFPGKNVVHQLDLMTELLGTPSAEAIARVCFFQGVSNEIVDLHGQIYCS